MKYVILDLIEVVVQGDGFCIRGSRMSEKNYETSELKELKDVLQTFTEFVWEMEEYLPEFYHFFDAMRQNIEIFFGSAKKMKNRFMRFWNGIGRRHMRRLWEYSVMIFKDHIRRQKQELVFILRIF